MVNADDPEVLALARAGARAPACASVRGRARGRRRVLRGRRRARSGSDGARDVLFHRADVQRPGRAPRRATSWPRPPRRACMGAPADAIRRAVRALQRASSTCSSAWPTIDGVAFYNDSKATNVDGRAEEPRGVHHARRAAHPRRALQGRRLRRPGARAARATARRCSRSAKRRTAIAAALSADAARRAPAARCEEAVEQGFGAGRSPATPCCSPPPARPSTCSRDYAARGRAFKDEVRRAGRPRRRPVAKKLTSDTTLFAVTVALLGARAGDGVERVLGAGPGAPRQRLLLPRPAGGVGLRSGSSVMVAAMRTRLPQAAAPGRRLLGGDRHHAAPAHRRPLPAGR